MVYMGSNRIVPIRVCFTLHFAVMDFDKVREQIKFDEGLRLKPYEDSTGHLTIGIGHNLEGRGLSVNEMFWLIENNNDRKNRFPKDFKNIDPSVLMVTLIKDMKKYGITENEAVVLCNNAIYDSVESLNSKLKWFSDAPETVQEVLTNMCYNMGIKTLLTFKNTLFYMSIGEYEKAAKNMLKSRWARQVKLRANRLAERIRLLQVEPE